MLFLNLNIDIALNPSLQVGDLIYACEYEPQIPAGIEQYNSFDSNGMGINNIVGVLRNIEVFEAQQYATLSIDNSMLENPYIPQQSLDFIMFSKFSLGDSGMLGYYADVKLVNNSKVKAEIFSIGSEVIINSK